jgi:sporulation protein YlmC with PRC-barrel domain
MELTTERIRGRNVIDNRGTNLGTVEDVAFDSNDWRIRGLVVNVRKEVADSLNLDRGTFSTARLELAPERVQAFGENVILNLDTDQLAGILRRPD